MITTTFKFRNKTPFDVTYRRLLSDQEARRVARNVRTKHARDLKRIFQFLKAENLLVDPKADKKRLFHTNALPGSIELLPESAEFYLTMPEN